MRFHAVAAIVAALLARSAAAHAAPPPALQPVQGQVIWVDFWASWCVPCRRSFPWMNTMQRKYGAHGLQIIAINLDKDRALADGFLAEVPAEFALRFDPAGSARQGIRRAGHAELVPARRRRQRAREPFRFQDGGHGRVRARDRGRARSARPRS